MIKHVVRGAAVALTPVIATAALTLTTAGPAQAARGDGDTRHCVSLKEYRQIHNGQRKVTVHRRVETRGTFWDGHAGGYTRAYEPCWTRPKKGQLHGGYTLVFITYADWPSRGHHWVAEKRIALPR